MAAKIKKSAIGQAKFGDTVRLFSSGTEHKTSRGFFQLRKKFKAINGNHLEECQRPVGYFLKKIQEVQAELFPQPTDEKQVLTKDAKNFMKSEYTKVMTTKKILERPPSLSLLRFKKAKEDV